MENAKDLSAVYNQYLTIYPTEANRLKEFQSFISRFDGRQLYNRKNFAGHITASAIVIDADNNEILLLEHKKLKRWLQPGGHVDGTDGSILHAALRELNEEANIKAGQVRLISPSNQLPVDIDSHLIPENAGKQEPLHYHHDLRFLFIYTGKKEILLNEDESFNYKWETPDALQKGDVLNTCIEKIRKLV